MNASVYRILDRSQNFPAEVSHPGHFRLDETGTANEDLVLDANWSLYCLDVSANRAYFVELPERTDLSEALFVYAAQFQNAVRVASVQLDALPALAMEVAEARDVSLLMSTGRCGSTLASQIFSKIPGVWSVSEPDWFTNLAFARFDLKQGQLEELIAACTRIFCRPTVSNAHKAIVLKPRSEMMVQAAQYVGTLQNANAVFLYRDCFGYVNSLYRFTQRILGEKDPAPGSANWEVARQLSTINTPMSLLDDFFPDNETIEFCDLLTLGWVLRMRAYLEASSGGMRVTPLHYEDLISDRPGKTASLLDSFGIASVHLDSALKGFQKDAHASSAGANSVPAEPISEAQRDRVAELVHRWGLSDYVTHRLPSIG